MARSDGLYMFLDFLPRRFHYFKEEFVYTVCIHAAHKKVVPKIIQVLDYDTDFCQFQI